MKKRILIDVDDVICHNHIFPHVNTYLASIGKKPFNNIEENGFKTGCPQLYVFTEPDELNKFYDYFLKLDSYLGIPPIEGAIEAVRQLDEQHEVYLVTACVEGVRYDEFSRQYNDKLRWVCKHLPFFDPKKFIACNRKHIFSADIIIDDTLKNLASEDIKTKILFSAFHNRNLSKCDLREKGVIRAEDWAEVMEIIHSL
jgi:5'(3')-deoxyribonucleotidase